jgi:hypothetical protein
MNNYLTQLIADMHHAATLVPKPKTARSELNFVSARILITTGTCLYQFNDWLCYNI